jgi:DNA-binding NarL/FixJ family response regulator
MKVLLIDDHPLILAALSHVIEALGKEVSVIAVDHADAARVALKSQTDLDLVLLDLHLGEISGFDLLDEFCADYPALPIVVISASEQAEDVMRAIDHGAMGFVPKRSGTDLLTEALQLVLAGGIYVPPLGCLPQQAMAEPVKPGLPGLTPRQNAVLALLLQGKPNKIIARELDIAVDTVKDHVAAVLKLLGVSSRTQAVLAVGQLVQGKSAAP